MSAWFSLTLPLLPVLLLVLAPESAFSQGSEPPPSTPRTQVLKDPKGVTHTFKEVSNSVPHEMGESWQDETSGLIWGDFLRNSEGEIDLMNLAQAKRRCEAIGARLPLDEEVRSLTWRMNHGFKAFPNDDYEPQILPNFSNSRLEAEVEELMIPILWLTLQHYKNKSTWEKDGPFFWTATEELQYNYVYGHYCNPTQERILRESPRFRGAGARCVIGKTPSQLRNFR